jgi:thiosulfate/3-mercaptopyruvate sulfurtransferase
MTMTYPLLVSTHDLAAHLDDPNWIVFDCRFILSQPDEKEKYYQRAHIPGAAYAHLDRDLSAPIVPGQTGRHPLPTPEEAARRFGQMGIAPGMQVVAYDDQGGSLAAVRLWWMLRWLGHEAAAVLDGGWQGWLEADFPVQSGVETRTPQPFTARPRSGLYLTSDEVEQIRRDPAYRLIDVRAAERYRGEVEPVDPVAGHIPGALNAPYTSNLNEEGRFRSPQELHEYYEALLRGTSADRAVFYCGSGVTSIHSLLALQIAGLGEAKLYAGSWSEWIASRQRPVALGASPG